MFVSMISIICYQQSVLGHQWPVVSNSKSGRLLTQAEHEYEKSLKEGNETLKDRIFGFLRNLSRLGLRVEGSINFVTIS